MLRQRRRTQIILHRNAIVGIPIIAPPVSARHSHVMNQQVDFMAKRRDLLPGEGCHRRAARVLRRVLVFVRSRGGEAADGCLEAAPSLFVSIVFFAAFASSKMCRTNGCRRHIAVGGDRANGEINIRLRRDNCNGGGQRWEQLKLMRVWLRSASASDSAAVVLRAAPLSVAIAVPAAAVAAGAAPAATRVAVGASAVLVWSPEPAAPATTIRSIRAGGAAGAAARGG